MLDSQNVLKRPKKQKYLLPFFSGPRPGENVLWDQPHHIGVQYHPHGTGQNESCTNGGFIQDAKRNSSGAFSVAFIWIVRSKKDSDIRINNCMVDNVNKDIVSSDLEKMIFKV